MKIEIKAEEFSILKVNETIETSQLVYGDEKSKLTANAPVTSAAYIENKHLLNPIAKSTVINLVQNEKVRGHIFLIERCFVFGGKCEPIIVASDLVSKANIPGSGVIIFRKAIKLCEDKKVPLLNFSNKDSDLIYSQILKIDPVIELDFQVGNINLKALLFSLIRKPKIQIKSHEPKASNKLMDKKRNFGIQIVSAFDFLIDDFLGKIENEDTYFGKRSSRILNWRFNSANGLDYHRILVKRDFEIVGYLIVCKRIFKGIKLLIIVDFVLLKLDSRERRELQKKLKKVYSDTCACLWVSNLNHTQGKFGKFRGLTIPRMLSPIRVKFYLSGSDESFKKSLKSAFLTLFDTDLL